MIYTWTGGLSVFGSRGEETLIFGVVKRGYQCIEWFKVGQKVELVILGKQLK